MVNPKQLKIPTIFKNYQLNFVAMALFQNAVIKKYLQAQNKEQLKEKWLQFQQHFHNLTIQENRYIIAG